MTIGGGLHNREPEPHPRRTLLRRVREWVFWGLLAVGWLVALLVGGLTAAVLTGTLAAFAGGVAVGYSARGNEDLTRTIERWR